MTERARRRTGAIVVSGARRRRDRAEPSMVEPVIDVPA